MKQFSVNKTSHGVGDCRFAVGHFTQGLWITHEEAVDIAQKIWFKFRKDFESKPYVEVSDYLNSAGRANGLTGHIQLSSLDGMTVGVLIHELAHLTKVAVNDKKVAIRRYVSKMSPEERGELMTNKQAVIEFGYKNRKNLNGHGAGFKKFQLKFLKYFINELIKDYEIVFHGTNLEDHIEELLDDNIF